MPKIDDMKAALKEAGVKFHPRHGEAKLLELMTANNVPMPSKVIKGSIIHSSYKQRYGKGQSCGDEVAELMKATVSGKDGKVDLAALEKVADDNGIDFSRWKGLNPGQQRMNLSNVLRGRVKRDEQVVIGTHKLGKAA